MIKREGIQDNGHLNPFDFKAFKKSTFIKSIGFWLLLFTTVPLYINILT